MIDGNDVSGGNMPASVGSFSDFLRFLARRTGLREDFIGRMEQDGYTCIYESAVSAGLTESIVASCIAEYFEHDLLEYIDPDIVVKNIFSAAYSRANLVVAVMLDGIAVNYVLSNPFDLELVDTIEMMSGGRGKLMVTPPDSIMSIIGGRESSVFEVESISIDRESSPAENTEDIDGIPRAGTTLEIDDAPTDAEMNSSPIKYLTDKLLFTAASEGVSDIHLEPKKDKLVVRFRVDGDMAERYILKPRTGKELLNRLKVLGGVDIAERRKPQDGSIEARISGGRFKMRLATTSTPYGESLIIRVLNQDSRPLTLNELGMTPAQAKLMQEITGQNAGAVIVVGPTGSGKSTTLYSLISSIDVTNRSLMTIEDPVEYVIPNANQQQVNAKAGVTFEALLRSAVRQDPDIVYLGEIRDSFTAKTAMDLASTGHMTFATLHSSNTSTSISRLERLGISREDMSDSVLLIESQRLLKKLCPVCRRVRPVEPSEAAMLSRFTERIPETVAEPVGCSACRAGYRGRQGVYELLRFNPTIIAVVREDNSAAEMRRLFRDNGQYLMSDHAVDLVREHVLALDDVYRLVLLEEFRLSMNPDENTHSGRVVNPTVPEAPKSKPKAVDDVPGHSDTSSAVEDGTETEGEASAGGKSILVVDDDRVIRSLLEHILESAGYSVTVTGDGVDAIVCMSTGKYDLILSDVDMPNLDGFRLLEIMRQKSMNSPVIFLTGKDSREDEAHGYELGAVDYIRKPIHKETFLIRVARVLR